MRTQNDGLQKQYNENGALDCSGDIDRARQQLKHDAHVKKLLAKFAEWEKLIGIMGPGAKAANEILKTFRR